MAQLWLVQFVPSPMDICAMNRTSVLFRLWLVTLSPLHNILVQVLWCSRVFTCNTGSQICFHYSASLHELGLAGECTLCPSGVYGNAHGLHLCFPNVKDMDYPITELFDIQCSLRKCLLKFLTLLLSSFF